MQRYLLSGGASLPLVSAIGCSPWRTDQVCYRIDRVEQTAIEALRWGTRAQGQVQPHLQQARRR